MLSLIPTLAIHKLQLLNIKREHIKKADLEDIPVDISGNNTETNKIEVEDTNT